MDVKIALEVDRFEIGVLERLSRGVGVYAGQVGKVEGPGRKPGGGSHTAERGGPLAAPVVSPRAVIRGR